MTKGIYKKILDIRRGLQVEKTGYDERNDYHYFKADDIAHAVRNGMNDHGVIHRVELLDVNDGNRIDSQGRERARTTTTSRVVFIDAEDGSEFPHEVVGSGSDIGGDKHTRKAAVQAFKIAAIDVFMVVEGLEKFDSDGDKEAEPEAIQVADAGEPTLTTRELNAIIAKITKDEEHPVTGAMVKAIGDQVAEREGIAKDSKVWRKESKVMGPLVAIVEDAYQNLQDGTASTIEEAIETSLTGEVK